MNFILALTAAIFYALQATLMAKFARSHSAVFAQSMRGLSFGITMLPLLLLGMYLDDDGLGMTILFSENLWLLVLTVVLIGLANWCIALSNTFLPVAFGSTIGTSISTIIMAFIGIFFFLDNTTLNQILLILILILSNFLFVLQKKLPTTEHNYTPKYGYIASCCFGVLVALGFSLVAKLSRDSHPFVVAYFWEFGTGIFLFFVMLIKGFLKKESELSFTFNELKLVALYSSPTVIGTAAYSYALKLGPLATVGAVQSSIMIFIAIFSSFIFKEKLALKRWLIIMFIFFILILLKVL